MHEDMMFDTYYQALCTYVMRYLISVEDARGYCSDGVYILVE